MIRDPDNPLRSPFAPSFLAAYASSIKLLRNVRVCFEHTPGQVLRLWPLWTHCLTSAVRHSEPCEALFLLKMYGE